MRLLLTLHTDKNNAAIPINYQYPLSSALYHIIAKGNAGYATFLHETGYGKGFKFFTFSQVNVPFTIAGDRMQLQSNELSFQVAFHLPLAAESFVKGLFQSEQIDIADKKSKASFAVESVESLPNPLQEYKDQQIINVELKPISPVVAGLPNEKGNYDFLSPEDERFASSIIHNWREKIKTCYDEATADSALLVAETILWKAPPKSRLMTIKADTISETKIRGWMNFGLKITAEKRFVELLLNAGAGVYNGQGMGCVNVTENKN